MTITSTNLTSPFFEIPSLVPHLVIRIRQIQMPVGALLRQHHHPDDTSRGAIPLDRLLECLLDKRYGFGFLHSFLPVGVAVTINVCGTGTTNRIRLLVQGAAERNVVHLTTVAGIPAGNNEAGTVEIQ